ncbi:DUF3854 domain-containing protein, partial [Anabaena azotica FACHB-119]|nr:DUF3854 domain-containing protein [Anabaena azotica FACHB-119]
LGLLAQRLHIDYKALFGNCNSSRDTPLPVHPAIKSQVNKIQPQQGESSRVTSELVSSLLSAKKLHQEEGGETGAGGAGGAGEELGAGGAGGEFTNSASPASPASPASLASRAFFHEEQSLSDLLDKLEKTGKLTIGEQRQLYNELVIQGQLEKEKNGQTDISLPPIESIVDDLIKQRERIIQDTYTPKVEEHYQVSQPQQPNNSRESEIEF